MLLKCTALILLFCIVKAQNYCETSLCPRGRNHIACESSGQFAKGCTGQIIDVRAFRDLILADHNTRRNKIASGSVAGFPSAVQMATMSWDDELARIAVHNAVRCRIEHDQCRNTDTYRLAGQNLGILYTSNVEIVTFLRNTIGSWFDEYRSANEEYIRKYRPRDGPAIGHFTAMINERNNRVGCAITKFQMEDIEATYLVCNYAVTNVINNPIYRFGPAGSQCRTGLNTRYHNLCSPREAYNHNVWVG